MMTTDPPEGIKFSDFDITLTDRELDDFLSFMEHQTTGVYADSMPQLPDAAMDFPGLQLQPHSGSPSRSEGSESAGIGTSGAACTTSGNLTRKLTTSDASLTSPTMSNPALEPAGASTGGMARLQLHVQQQASPSCSPIAISSQQQLPSPVQVKMEQDQHQALHQQQQQCIQAGRSLPPVLGAVGTGASACTSLASTLPATDTTTLMSSCPGTLDMVPAGFALQPMQWQSSTAAATLMPLAPGLQQQSGESAEAALSRVMFVQTPGGVQQQQQQPVLILPQAPINQQLAAFAGLASGAGPPSSVQVDCQSSAAAGRASRQLQQLQLQQQQQQQQRLQADLNSGKLQISHSTVEKQRRDRLNSLIDELSDMVPPADPKYGSDTNSVRRPKHVVLADTINLLKAMQTKLQVEEAEICTLKQQAAAVGAIAAQQQSGHATVTETADAMLHAAACGSLSPDPSQGDLMDCPVAAAVELPQPPAGSAGTGVLVEQGIGCLYVKVNCSDRKGLLSDVVSALKAFPIVISTAAITTTKDGKVHDVFEVRTEDPTVTAEDIQYAVQQALFSAQRTAQGKRLRRNESGVPLQA